MLRPGYASPRDQLPLSCRQRGLQISYGLADFAESQTSIPSSSPLCLRLRPLADKSFSTEELSFSTKLITQSDHPLHRQGTNQLVVFCVCAYVHQCAHCSPPEPFCAFQTRNRYKLVLMLPALTRHRAIPFAHFLADNPAATIRPRAVTQGPRIAYSESLHSPQSQFPTAPHVNWRLLSLHKKVL